LGHIWRCNDFIQLKSIAALAALLRLTILI
jgi:hypothetical protein